MKGARLAEASEGGCWKEKRGEVKRKGKKGKNFAGERGEEEKKEREGERLVFEEERKGVTEGGVGGRG